MGRDKGFTLIEAMIAMVLLAVAAGGVLLPFGAGAAVQTEAARQHLAARIAADTMEDIISQDYASIPAYCASLPSEVAKLNGDPLTGGVYSDLTQRATCEPGMMFSGTIKVHVYVDYKGQRIVDMVTLVGRP